MQAASLGFDLMVWHLVVSHFWILSEACLVSDIVCFGLIRNWPCFWRSLLHSNDMACTYNVVVVISVFWFESWKLTMLEGCTSHKQKCYESCLTYWIVIVPLVSVRGVGSVLKGITLLSGTGLTIGSFNSEKRTSVMFSFCWLLVTLWIYLPDAVAYTATITNTIVSRNCLNDKRHLRFKLKNLATGLDSLTSWHGISMFPASYPLNALGFQSFYDIIPGSLTWRTHVSTMVVLHYPPGPSRYCRMCSIVRTFCSLNHSSLHNHLFCAFLIVWRCSLIMCDHIS